MKNNKIVNIRALAIIIVVLGHSIILYSTSWGIYQSINKVKFLDTLKNIINLIQMPLFFSISGFLLYYSLNKNINFREFIIKKVKRLIIPFIIFGIFWMIPIKLLVNYPGYQNLNLNQIILRLLTGNDSGHLWYLPTLFIIFLMIVFLKKCIIKNFDLVLFVILLVVSYFSSNLQINIFIKQASFYAFYFYLGTLINKYQKISLNKYIIILILLNIILLKCFCDLKIFEYLLIVFTIILIYKIIPNQESKILKIISENSYSIYLFHSPLIYITFTYLKNANPIIVIFINFILFGGMSLLLSIIIEKIKKIVKRRKITMKKNIDKIIKILLAFTSYITIIKLGGLESYSTLSLLIFLFLAFIYLKYFKITKDNKDIVLLSFFFAFLFIIGRLCLTFINARNINILIELFKIKMLIYLIGCFGLIFTFLNLIIPKLLDLNIIKKSKKLSPLKVFIISFIIFIISWLPFFLAFFPATISPDGMGLFYKSQSELVMIDNHTFAYSVFMRLCCIIGQFLFSSTTATIATTTAIQSLIMALIFAYLVMFLYQRNIDKKIILGVILYFALTPIFGYYSVVMWKDILFSGFVVLLSISCYKLVEKKDNLSKKEYISFILSSILVLFFRNNAIYMYFILAILTCIFYKKYLKQFISIFIIIIGGFYFIKGPVFDYFKIIKSGSAEYLAMPMQQIGRMVYKDVKLTKKEEKMISKILDVEIMKDAYDPRWSDGIKFNKDFSIEAFNKNKFDYLKLWMTLVVKHPSTAIEAYLISTLGYWYPDILDRAYENSIVANEYDITMQPKGPKILGKYVAFMGSRDIPLLSLLISIGLFMWIIFISIFILIKKKNYSHLYTYIPVLGIWITLLIASPVYNEVRYIYSLFTTFPLLVLIPYFSKNKNI